MTARLKPRPVKTWSGKIRMGLRKAYKKALQSAGLYMAWKRVGHYPDYWYWQLRGKPPRSPHLLKQKTVLEYARRFNLTTLIETGTYYGEMVEAAKSQFRTIHTIEYDKPLADLAAKRFASNPNIHVICNDSQVAIPELLKAIKEPCLFWLDAGYYGWSGFLGNTDRLTSELESILRHHVRAHVILMDDARAMNGMNGSPRIEDFLDSMKRNHSDRQVEVKYDIIRITPLMV